MSGRNFFRLATTHVPAMSSALINFAGAGTTIIVPGVAAQRVFVFKLFLVVGGATNLTFYDDSATPMSGAVPMLANGSIVLDFDSEPWFSSSVGNGFGINSSSAVQVSGTLLYMQGIPGNP
jgi:hypothetical protein